MGFDPVSYLMGKAAGGGGSGSNVIIGNTIPTPDVGEEGQYYIQEIHDIVVDDVITYWLEIEKAGRGTNQNFRYWGAREIDIIFTDGTQDYHFRDFTEATCKWSAGTPPVFQQIDSNVIDGQTNNYSEHYGSPGWYEFSAQIPTSYSLKTVSICGRNDSQWQDYLVSFRFGQAAVGSFINTIVSESNLTYEDWNHESQDSYTQFSPSTPVKVEAIYSGMGSVLYNKKSIGWVQLE